MKKIIKILKQPYRILWFLGNHNLFPIKDSTYLKIAYRCQLGKKLNINCPITFNEKLQWLKLNNRKKIYTTMVDKFEAKKYVSNIIGEKYIIPTIGIYNSFEEIDFGKLPDKFVIKCTHDSGGLIICNDKSKLDIEVAKKKINKCLKVNYYYPGREWPYKSIKPRIIIEKYMIDNTTKELRDYKFFCFNGKVEYFKIDFNRFVDHHANYYDRKGNLMQFGEKDFLPDPNADIKMPVNLNTMIKLSEKLSEDIPFIRVDFYEINGKIFFGELTFYPASGFGKFEPEEWDKKFGDLIKLPKK